MIKIEQEFRAAMVKLYPKLPLESPQAKTARLMFYMGALRMLTPGKTEQDAARLVQEVCAALEQAAKVARQGIQPEETLAVWANREET